MDADHPVFLLFLISLGGLFLGFGIVIGAFVARALRKYMAEEDIRPYHDDRYRRRRDDDDGQ